MAASSVVPRRIVLLLQLTQAGLCGLLGLALGWKGDDRNALVCLLAAFVCAVLREAFRRGWDAARPVNVLVVALMVVAFLREPHLTVQPSLAIFLPPMLALVLTSGHWVVAISLVEYVALILRGGAASTYLVPNQAMLFASVVAGLALSRVVMDGAVARANAQGARADEARREAERRAFEIAAQQERMKRLEEELHHAQRLEAIGRLAGGVAHDFNNLLTVIGGAAVMAQRTLPADHRAVEDLDEIGRAVSRASELTRQLLAFARKQVLVKRPVDLSQLVLGMDRMLRRLIGEDVTFTTRLADGPLVVNADAGQIEQVILNLAINARDAMPNGGTISISTSLVQSDTGGPEGAPCACLEVSDSGTGMSDEVQSRAFEPFFTTKESGRGTGLGLATCFGIVKQHGGHIRIASASGRGTKMTVLLPATSSSVEEPVTVVRSTPRGAERVLLVEDDDAVRKLLAEALREVGYRVTVAEDGRRALSVLEGPETFEVLVSDVVMPKLGGKELCRRARQRDPRLALVLISGYAESLLGEEVRMLDASVFLQKPFTPRELVHSVQEAILLNPPSRECQV